MKTLRLYLHAIARGHRIKVLRYRGGWRERICVTCLEEKLRPAERNRLPALLS